MADDLKKSETTVAAIINVEPASLPNKTELAVLLFSYDPVSFEVTQIIDSYTGQSDSNEAEKAGPQKVSDSPFPSLTGSLDVDRINKMLEEPEILIAHSAESAKSLVCRLFQAARGKRWRCSHRDLDWQKFGPESRDLKWLLHSHQIEAETPLSAENGAVALLKLLKRKASDGQTYLAKLLKK